MVDDILSDRRREVVRPSLSDECEAQAVSRLVSASNPMNMDVHLIMFLFLFACWNFFFAVLLSVGFSDSAMAESALAALCLVECEHFVPFCAFVPCNDELGNAGAIGNGEGLC